jgi:RNA-directed DNA polymerase
LTQRLATPEKLRTLQRKLYAKAKTDPAFRFYSLHDKIWRSDVLAHAFALAKANGGAPGVDGESFAAIEARGVETWLAGLAQELKDGTYRPQPVRRVTIPKPDGGERPLGIPTVRDRVAQTAAKLILEPIFEADFEPNAYGYRPGRSALDAVREVHRLLLAGHTDVVDADLSQYFDEIPHRDLLRSVAQRVADRNVLRLIKLWLKAPVAEQDERGHWVMTGGKKRSKGTPQGGVLSPVLANLYMNRFLKYWRRNGHRDQLQAHVVAYADDLVILTRGHAGEAMARLRSAMPRLGLTVNETKTATVDAHSQQFDFLGYSFGAHYRRWDGKWYLGASPSKKSVQRLKANVRALLVPSNSGNWLETRDRLNRMLRGWAGYFCYGSRGVAYRAVDAHVAQRTRHFLRRRHKVASRATRQFGDHRLFGELGILSVQTLSRAARWNASP